MKMKTLDQIIIELEGIWNFKFDELVAYEMTQPPKRLLISKSEFQQRAKELGFVGKYRWGVEYKSDGKRPELSDDVVVECSLRNEFSHREYEENKVSEWRWDFKCHGTDILAFKITDQRYKPTDTSYLDKPERFGLEAPESLNRKCSSSDVQFKDDNGADWYDYDNQKALRLPPVGVECEYEDSPEVKGYSKCTILAVLNDAFAFSRPDYKNTIFTGNLRTHVIRPLDFDRKAKAERKRVVDAVMKEFPAANELILCDMYGKGFLRLPD
jgi:hypothetical protein